MKYLKSNIGISLITLVITIIVIIILAGAIILSLASNNPIGQAKEASFKENIQSYESELTMWLTKEYASKLGSLDISTINADKSSGTYNNLKIKDIIPSIKSEDEDSFVIEEGALKYVGTNEEEQVWASNIHGSGSEDDGQSGSQAVPVDVAAGMYHTVVLMDDGTVKAWGDNYEGQLGDGTTQYRTNPETVEGLTDVKQISAGQVHTVALLNDGTVKAWGDNGYGQLGDGTWEDKLVPTAVPGLTNVKEIIAGEDHTLALLNDGTIKAWGYNGDGELGDGTWDDKNIPQSVAGVTDVKQVSAGNYHTLALLNNGTIKAWGGNWCGQLGNSTFNDKTSPITVIESAPDFSSLINMEINGYWSQEFAENTIKLNFTSDGSVNSSGFIITKIRYVENGETFEEDLLEPIVNTNYADDENVMYEISKPNATSISINFKILDVEYDYDYLTILNSLDEELYSYTGAVYTDSLSLITSPLSGVKQISAGEDHTLLLLNDETVMGMGCNYDGQLGIEVEDDYSVPTVIPGVSNVKQVAAGGYHSLALLNDGTLKAWGANWCGQLCDGSFDTRFGAITMLGISDAKKVVAGEDHTIILLNTGVIKGVGCNNSGQLGVEVEDDYTSAVTVPIN
jgi:alpha-tubulin suppressor-like RCC1 family protein/type II secretory pathway pseudopilin PulG